jgi:hypothetical protein
VPYVHENSLMRPNPTDFDREFQQLLELVLAGKKNDPLVLRAREKGDALRKQMRAKYGHRNIALKLIRDARDDE